MPTRSKFDFDRHEIQHKIAIDMFKTIKKALDDNNIEFWLDAGTLLGAVRDKKFILGDYDIDICIWKENTEKVREILDSLPYYYYFDKEENWFYRIFHERTRFGIGLVEFDEKNCYYESYLYPRGILGKTFDYLLWALSLYPAEYKDSLLPVGISKLIIKTLTYLPFRKKIKRFIFYLYERLDSYYFVHTIPYEFFMPLRTEKVYDIKVKVPKNSERYLEHRYGKDWTIPNPNYKYWLDDGTLKKYNRRKCYDTFSL